MKLAHVALLAAVGLVAAAFAGAFQPPRAASAPAADASPGGITVAGTGSVPLTPDRAGFTFGTVSRGSTAAAALAASSKSTARIVEALRKAGVAKADIQTSEVSVSPRMDENGNAVVGYTATNSVTATIRRIGAAGDVVDAAVGAGANQVYGPSLLVSDREAAYRRALAAAVAEARSKAEVLATTAHVSIGAVTAIAESGDSSQPVFATARLADSSTKIEPGTQSVEATISVTFAVGR
jgi:uncharacterized protein YggE